MKLRLLLLLFAAQAMAAMFVACGARSQLEVGEGVDSVPDAHADVMDPIDAPMIVDVEVPPDAPPILDVVPPIDVTPPMDGNSCPTDLSAYILTQDGQLYTFDPPTLATSLVGALACPTANTPFTLTVADTGMLYVLYTDWLIYQVDPQTLACSLTPYDPGPFTKIGLTVAPGPNGEVLYVYGMDGVTVLDVGDLASFELAEVGPVAPDPGDFPLDIRADPFGRLFGLGEGGTFAEIDPKTGAVVETDVVDAPGNSSWALLTWNDALYLFFDGSVSRYDVATKQQTLLGDVGLTVVGATAAPCIH